MCLSSLFSEDVSSLILLDIMMLCLALFPSISLAQWWFPTQQSFPLCSEDNIRTIATVSSKLSSEVIICILTITSCC